MIRGEGFIPLYRRLLVGLRRHRVGGTNLCHAVLVAAVFVGFTNFGESRTGWRMQKYGRRIGADDPGGNHQGSATPPPVAAFSATRS